MYDCTKERVSYDLVMSIYGELALSIRAIVGHKVRLPVEYGVHDEVSAS